MYAASDLTPGLRQYTHGPELPCVARTLPPMTDPICSIIMRDFYSSPICTLCLGHTDEDSFGHSLRGSPLPHVQDERIVVSYSGNRRPGPFVTSESQLTHRNAVSHAEKVSAVPLVS